MIKQLPPSKQNYIDAEFVVICEELHEAVEKYKQERDVRGQFVNMEV